MLRAAIKLFILVAAAGGPILYFKAPHIWANVKQTCSNALGSLNQKEKASGDSDSATAGTAGAPTSLAATPLGVPQTPIHEGVVTDFSEVLRFDITTGWIMNRWPRVSTGMAQLQLQGYRVPLVTGTRLDDVAGSLTYYFNPYQQVQLITFSGTTGDATRLIQTLAKQYGFQRQLTKDGGLFVYVVPNEKKEIQSMLKIRPSGVISTDQPHNRFQVDVIIHRPATESEKQAATGSFLPKWGK